MNYIARKTSQRVFFVLLCLTLLFQPLSLVDIGRVDLANACHKPCHKPKINLTKDCPEYAEPGQTVTYTLNWSVKDASVTNLTLTDELPEKVGFVSATGNYNLNNKQVVWDLGDKSAGETGQEQLSVRFDDYTYDTDVITNMAILDSDETDAVDACCSTEMDANCILEISKIDDQDPVQPGDEITYTIEYENTGNGVCVGTGVIVQENYDPRTTFVSAGPEPDYGNNMWQWTELLPDKSHTIQIVVETDEDLENGDVLENKVCIWAENFGTVCDIQETTIGELEPDLSVTKTVSDDDEDNLEANIAHRDELMTYTIEVTNNGEAVAVGVELIDDYDGGKVIVKDDGGGTKGGGQIVWTLGDVGSGETIAKSVKVQVKGDLADQTQIRNTATVSADNHQSLDDLVVTTIEYAPPQEPNLTILKTVTDVDEQDPGLKINTAHRSEIMTYLIKYANNGNEIATSVQVVDDYDQTKLGIISKNSGVDNTDTITWALNDLAPGEAGTLSIEVELNDDLNNDDQIVNQVTITASNALRQEDEVVTQVEVIDRPDCVKLGYSQSYRVEDVQTGVYNIDADNQLEISGRVYNNSNEVLVFDWLADLAMGAVIVKSGEDYNEYVYSPAVYSAIGVESKDQALGISYVDFCFDYPPALPGLSITKTVTDDDEDNVEANTAHRNETMTYTITIENSGNGAATGVELIDDYDGGKVIVKDDGGGTKGGGQIVWTLGDVGLGETITKSVKVQVKGDLADQTQIRNTATVSADNHQSLDDLVVTTIEYTQEEGADISINKFVSDDDEPDVKSNTAHNNEYMTYRIDYTNSGTTDAVNVTIIDDYDQSKIMVINPGTGIDDGDKIEWDLGDLATGTSETLLVSVKIKDSLADGISFKNHVVIKVDDIELQTDEVTTIIDVPDTPPPTPPGGGGGGGGGGSHCTGKTDPIADAGFDKEAYVGQKIRFDASESSDKDNDKLSFAWDMDRSDGVQIPYDLTGKVVDYEGYNQAGLYEVTLRVQDNCGFSLDIVTVQVKNLPQVAGENDEQPEPTPEPEPEPKKVAPKTGFGMEYLFLLMIVVGMAMSVSAFGLLVRDKRIFYNC